MKYLWLLSFLFIGCAHSVHQYSVSEYNQKGGKLVEAQAEQFAVMGFLFDTNYADKAYRDLIAQCPNHSLSGIQTRYMTSLGFFSWTHKVKMSALCGPH